MKKIFLISILLGSAMLMANSSAERKKTMQSLEVSMAFIQKGFLYNHRGKIEKGVNTLREALKNINSFVIENDKNVKFNAKEYAVTETKALDLMASRILDGFDKGKKEAVLVDFQQMLKMCNLSCSCKKMVNFRENYH